MKWVENRVKTVEKSQVFQSEFDLWIKLGGETNWSELQVSSSAKLEDEGGGRGEGGGVSIKTF